MNRADLRAFVLGIAGRMLKWSTVSSAGTKFGRYESTLPPADAGEPKNTQPVRNFSNYGFRAALPPGTEIIVGAPRGGATNAVVLASDNMGHGPTDLEEGEVAVYNKVSGTVIKLDKDGNVTVVPGASAKVRLGDAAAANLSAVALYTTLKTEFDAFVAKFNGHTHVVSGTAAAGVVTGTAAATTTPATAMTAAVGSSNVQAKK